MSALFVALVALLSVGCMGQAEGPEEFAFVTEYGGLATRFAVAADQINEAYPEVLVTVRVVEWDEVDPLINLAPYDPCNCANPNPDWVVIDATPRTHILAVGDEANTAQIYAGIKDWIAMFTTRD